MMIEKMGFTICPDVFIVNVVYFHGGYRPGQFFHDAGDYPIVLRGWRITYFYGGK
jgi:hypothetical protein